MAILDDETRAAVKERLAALAGPVNLVLFTTKDDTEGMSGEIAEILGELSALSDKVSLEHHDLGENPNLVYRYGIERAPAIVVESDRDYGIRYYGAPAGHEFQTLIEVMADVARGDADLPPELRELAQHIGNPVHVQVFVTPTCGYCPRAVRVAQKLAIVSDNVRADCIEITEFPDLAEKYNISGVPKSVFNETVEVIGGVPEDVFLGHVLEAARMATKPN